jgi:hypothetical protein
MPRHHYLASTFFLILALKPALMAQPPVIHGVSAQSAAVEQHGKFEATLSLSASYGNPYDYDEIAVSARFTGPAGQEYVVDGFFMQEYELSDEAAGLISALGTGVFKVRFAPDQPGSWSYQLFCTQAEGMASYPAQSFECLPPTAASVRGLVRSDQSNYLHFDNGEAFIPLGQNLAWHNGNPIPDYRRWLSEMQAQGANFFRLWHCHWGLGLEWLGQGYQGLRQYHQPNAFYLDWLFDFCAERGLYALLCLQHHGQVSTTVNPNWAQSPYNAANGGMCHNTWDFFADPLARQTVRNRLRYCVARWAYARSLAGWELFNEVDWTDQYAQHQALVDDWHLEMAAFLKARDPGRRLVTTSFAQADQGSTLWASPDIDFTQTHYYAASPHLERGLASGTRQYLDAYGKPTLNGEFSISVSGAGLGQIDPDGIHFHNGLWGSVFAGALGGALSWWWDSYLEPQGLYHHYAALAALLAELPLREGGYQPTPASVRGQSADLVLKPTLDWGALADTIFTIDEQGYLMPEDPQLSHYLYGAQWNTQYRRPPVFTAYFAAPAEFQVRTGSASGEAPRLAIWVDGVLQWEQPALPQQTYTLAIPAGQHTIKVDNTGTDWITIAAYVFTGLGRAVDAYVLRAEGEPQLAGWVLNNRYNHDYLSHSGLPPLANGNIVAVPGFPAGTYAAQFFDCLTGAPLQTATAVAEGDSLYLPLPDFLWDLAFALERQPVPTREPLAQALPARLYPNPLTGSTLTVALDLLTPAPLSIALLDATGRDLGQLYSAPSMAGEQEFALEVPASLPAGLYWLRVQAGKQAAALPVVLLRS